MACPSALKRERDKPWMDMTAHGVGETHRTLSPGQPTTFASCAVKYMYVRVSLRVAANIKNLKDIVDT